MSIVPNGMKDAFKNLGGAHMPQPQCLGMGSKVHLEPKDSNRVRVHFWHGTPGGYDSRRSRLAQNELRFD
jgi:hypothetical protein